jgi:diguanylate cyclase (GGDEF)-like protein
MESAFVEVHSHLLPHLLTLLQSGQGTAEERIRRALEAMSEQLELQTAFVSRFVEGTRHVTHVAGRSPAAEGLAPSPVAETVCGLFAAGAVDPTGPDDAQPLRLRTHPQILALGIGTYIGIPLMLGGEIVGAVCGVSSSARPALTERDAGWLTTVAGYVGQILAEPEPAGAAERAAASELPRLAAALTDSDNLESLTRPLLELLNTTTGLESTYLTLVDWAADEQRVLHSVNSGKLDIAEGLVVPWADTLCRRALDQKVPYTRDVPGIWGDSEMARALGIQTYVSVPITDADDAVIGTLCGLSKRSALLEEKDLQSMRLFARILADQFSREHAREREQIRAQELERRTEQLHDKASRDALTGLLNRSGIHTWLEAMIPGVRTIDAQLVIAFIDIDDFKRINDVYGHATGDDVLRRLAASLLTVGRPGDLHGRLGGDEFVVAALLPATEATFAEWSNRLRQAACIEVDGTLVTASVGISTVTDPATTPDSALHVADEAMYRRKAEQRRATV